MTSALEDSEGKRKKRENSDTEFLGPRALTQTLKLRWLHEGMTRNFDIREVTVGEKHAKAELDKEKGKVIIY